MFAEVIIKIKVARIFETWCIYWTLMQQKMTEVAVMLTRTARHAKLQSDYHYHYHKTDTQTLSLLQVTPFLFSGVCSLN